MNNPFKKVFKQYFYFSKGDRNAIIILGSLIFVITVGIIIVNNLEPKSTYNYAQYEQLLEKLEAPKENQFQNKKSLFVFDPNTVTAEMLDTLDLPVFVKKNILNYRNAGGQFTSFADIRKIYGMNDSIFEAIKNYINISEKEAVIKIPVIKEGRFKGIIDPNSADYKQLVEFGFNSFQSNNIVGYRKKGGTFSTQSDLLKIYGIDSAFFILIANHLQIEVDEKSTIEESDHVLIQVELNSADTTDLMKLNGVGSIYAKRILKYRDLLGGFHSVSQLREVYNFSEETYKIIEHSISADTLLLKKIRLNFAEFVDLLRHPYLNKKQVESVLNYRDQNGSFKNIHQLKANGLIDSETFRKVSPYLTCR